ncbi:fumarylacetoacetase [Cladophialophora bantiana CBS 173.52]|uniref:Fumarylacetoacetase n=1 Tax=Cladophialophora bantiana (strain ATCC 10958 / CBS 173.52 / CDC B-1940 / NIH 8579) TaxID=1442370 RepID=A0A0D2IRB4_CLAB1|nr:fumarylacetoacetase [Cladophialophora bantiana CBS 173.52]KIW99294.1 fumarylacetoacetase [Cladophialophora bantiana CBS 173.52]
MVATSFPISISKDSPFGLYNIPFGVFSTLPGIGHGPQPRAGVAIGDLVIELHVLADYGVFGASPQTSNSWGEIFLEPVLNSFAALPAEHRKRVRSTIIENLSKADSMLFTIAELNEKAFVAAKEVQMHLPMKITDYTDSFSSLIHAQNSMHPLGLELPRAFTEYPMGYNGRISSIRPSGTDVVRPSGFYLNDGDSRPTFQPTKQLDFEIELGAFISKPIPFGTTVDANTAADHIFGYVLHNDWSARDIQKYEMPPLGPLHSKGFITTISPWVVTVDALDSSKTGPPTSNGTNIHPSLVADERNHGVYDIEFTAIVKRGANAGVEIVRSNYASSYWSMPQQVAYQSSTGHGINTGDLVASGTISSPAPEVKKGLGTYGCLLEALAQKHVLPEVDGEPMSWIKDGDEFTIEGWFNTEDGGRGGFGGLRSLILPARPSWP